ncbi:MAG: hypothetical protein D8M52_00045 [Chlorobi bacterium]|nr:hypothetical protein [Chlorobiota bacterium]
MNNIISRPFRIDAGMVFPRNNTKNYKFYRVYFAIPLDAYNIIFKAKPIRKLRHTNRIKFPLVFAIHHIRSITHFASKMYFFYRRKQKRFCLSG